MNSLETLVSQTYKFGHLSIPSSMVFWQKQHCYCIIPVVQLLPGHILVIPKRTMMSYQDMEYAEVFDLALTIRLITKSLEQFFGCSSSTIYVQSYNKVNVDVDRINHCFVHIIPRKANDMKKNDDLYPLFEAYDKDFQRQFNTNIAQGNQFSIRMLETLGIEAKKYNEHLSTTSQQDNQLQSL